MNLQYLPYKLLTSKYSTPFLSTSSKFTISCWLRSILPTEGVYRIYNSHLQNRVQTAKMVRFSRKSFISSTSPFLCFQFLPSPGLHSDSSQTIHPQLYKLSLSALNAVRKYTGVICFRNVSVIVLTLVFVCKEPERSSPFFFLDKLISVTIQFSVLSKSIEGYVTAFLTTAFSSSVFSTFYFSSCRHSLFFNK